MLSEFRFNLPLVFLKHGLYLYGKWMKSLHEQYLWVTDENIKPDRGNCEKYKHSICDINFMELLCFIDSSLISH